MGIKDCVGENIPDERFECNKYGFFLLPPCSASKSFEYVQSGSSARSYEFGVRGESEMGVESDS